MGAPRVDRKGEVMDAESIARRIHDASVELGADCDSTCYFNPSGFASYEAGLCKGQRQHKSWTVQPARVLTLLASTN